MAIVRPQRSAIEMLRARGISARVSVRAAVRAGHDVPESIRAAVRNDWGGYYNHNLFWQIMGPDKKQQQTFEIILPNLIHKSKKRNLR